MKLDAIKHQGVSSSQIGKKLLSIERVGEESGENRNKVHRYIRLTYLILELLMMVDENKIAFSPTVKISYLEHSEQFVLLYAIAHCFMLRAYSLRNCCRKDCSTKM